MDHVLNVNSSIHSIIRCVSESSKTVKHTARPHPSVPNVGKDILLKIINVYRKFKDVMY